MLPEGMAGDALNYGQGEGQLRIGGAVWGFYRTDSGDYSCVLEEEVLSFEEAWVIAVEVIGRMRSLWENGLRAKILSCHHDDPEMRFTTRLADCKPGE